MARKISQTGINLIIQFEGCRLTAYQDSVKVWTIGYGHTAGVTQGMHITQAEAEAFLRQDLTKFEGYVNNNVYVPVTASLNQNQFDALVSFAYNCGQENLKKLCKNRTLEQIAAAIPKYNKAGGVELTGLIRRRAAEQALYNTASDGSTNTVTQYQTAAKIVPSTNCLILQKAINHDKIAKLTEDGKCGPKTKAAINKVLLKAKLNKTTGKYVVGSTGETVRFVQMRLGIAEDGLYGAGTRTAVIAWQEEHNLTVDGIVGPATLMTMV
jgi:GH24 family phage-related lysozyme (muramidase)